MSDLFLLEDASGLLLENADHLLLESAVSTATVTVVAQVHIPPLGFRTMGKHRRSLRVVTSV